MKSIVPAFRPSFTVDRNGKRTYDLIPNRISLVKYGEDSTSDGTGDEGNNSTPTPNPSDKGDSTGGGSDSGNTDTGDTGSGTGGDGNVNFE